MNQIDEYVEKQEGVRKERVAWLINYIRVTYPNVEERMDFGPKWIYPVLRVNDIYVAIASNKTHLSIHFGKYNVTSLFKECKGIKTMVGCINIKDSALFPMEILKEAIKMTYEN